MNQSRFSQSPDHLREIVRSILDWARSGGASAAEAEISESLGLNVTVRCGEVETIEHNRDKGLGVTVYLGKRRGHSSTSDFSQRAVRDTVDAALTIARYTAEDECAGLADEDLLARKIPDLELFHPWGISVAQAVDLAKECEAAAFSVDKRVANSEGAAVHTQESQFIYGNSLEFLAGYPSSRHAISCAVIAGRGDAMQRDDWYSTARHAGSIESAKAVGRRAGERSIARLRARKIKTREAPVLFEAPVAASLLSHFVAAASGGNLYRKASFLVDQLGRRIFAPWVEIQELPLLPRGLGSSPFDNEGVRTRSREVVKEGVLQGYFLSSYSARKLNMRSTGNAGGNHNLVLQDNGLDFSGLLRQMGEGLLVTELLGHGVNLVTGDYSRGAAGFWVEGGAIAYPVQEVTIAGNLKNMFNGMAAAGNDVIIRGSRHCGSILIEHMMVAGQ
jgi:PmbA protein